MAHDRAMLLHRAKVYLDDPTGVRKELGVAESVLVKSKINYVEQTKPGSNQKYRYPSTYEVTFTIGVFQGTNFFTKLIDEFIETGKMQKFSMLGVQDDPNSTSGRRSTLVTGCVIEEDTLLNIGSNEEVAKQNIPGYAEAYKNLDDFVEFDDEY